jgi:hypothetical protein
MIRQLLIESLLLSAAAGALGVLLALYGLHLYGQSGPRNLIRGAQPAINGWVVAFSVVLSMAASVIFGLAPALDGSRVDLSEALKEGSRGSAGNRWFLRESTIAIEVAVSLILVIGAGLLVRSFIRMEAADPGFDPKNLLTAHIALPVNLYKQPAQRIAFERSLLRRVAALPGVLTAGATEFMPFISAPAEAHSRSSAIREMEVRPLPWWSRAIPQPPIFRQWGFC